MKPRTTIRARTAAVLCATALAVTGCASNGDGNAKDADKPSSGSLSVEEVYTNGLHNIEEGIRRSRAAP